MGLVAGVEWDWWQAQGWLTGAGLGFRLLGREIFR